jgi:deazaflavin-dependent oxidoreductase (nitroreductase family)
MDEAVRKALENDLVIDITTTGGKTGRPRRKEIWFHNVDGQLYLTGSPGRRDWYANLRANPEFTFHLKRATQVDLPARATPVLDKARRREILQKIHQRFAGRRWNLDAWVEGRPLVQVEILSHRP